MGSNLWAYSGSYIMPFVLAKQKNWLEPGKEPFEFVILDNFKNLRDAVNSMLIFLYFPGDSNSTY
jgi:hypothetical protein